jgi:LysM repeat protein
MKRILISLVKCILGVAVVLLSGCATPSFFQDRAPGPSPEDTIIRRNFTVDRMASPERVIAAPLRPEPEPEEVLIVEVDREEIKAEPAGAVYVVKKGDCLSWLAKKYNVRFQDLLKANALDKNAKLFVGQRLILPGVTEEQLAQTSTSPTEYVVQKGDCLSKIAQKYGLKVHEIKAANAMKSDRIVAGKKIIIPERGRYANSKGEKGKPPAKVEEAFAVDVDGYYTLKKGDMLSKIAARAKVSVSDLQKWNNISDPAKIRAGQKIIVRQKISQPVNVAPKPAALSPSGESNATPESAKTLPVRRYDFMDDADFFGKIDEIPIVQVHE